MNVCAGIVTYNPNLERLLLNVQSIYKQVDKVFVVDNGSDNILSIKTLISAFSNVYLYQLGENKGIAYALNCICKQAINDNYEWVLTLDQDSVSHEDLVKTLMLYSSDKELGIITPSIIYEGVNNKRKKESEVLFVKACMSSGSLTNLNAYKAIGGFDDSLFIDFVDNDYCMKLNLSGYKVLKVNSTYLEHELGEIKTIRVLGVFKKRVFGHSYIRLYYMARNNKYFINKYRKHLNVVKEKIKLQSILFFEWLASDNKKTASKFIKAGLKDAKKNILGRYCLNIDK